MGNIERVEPETGHELAPDALSGAVKKRTGTFELSRRSDALGGLEGRCDRCGAEQPRYRSCGDRHCPQCQGRATEAWSEHQSANQLPVPYFHRVFTLPHRLNPWV